LKQLVQLNQSECKAKYRKPVQVPSYPHAILICAMFRYSPTCQQIFKKLK